jgi:RNA polymerase sigma-70 factor (ECF subfamily)
MAHDVDDAVLRRFVDGDREAFEALYRQFDREAYRWILRIVRDPAAAEDALVDTFWRVYRGRARFDPARPFGAWLRRIATNAALDQVKSMGSRPSQHDGSDVVAPAAPDAGMRSAIVSAMQALPVKLRVVAVLALIEEEPLAAIADALDIPLGTVKSRLFRATRALRAALTRLGIER